jgi:predicted  nucleic acid-binding Zn-ribbon protein
MNHKDKILVQQSLSQALSRVAALKKQVSAAKTALKKAEEQLQPEASAPSAEKNMAALQAAEQAITEQIAAADNDPADPMSPLRAALKKIARGCDCPNLKEAEE